MIRSADMLNQSGLKQSLESFYITRSKLTSVFEPLANPLRIHWAILTGRDKMAELLWEHSVEPFVSALLCSYVYRHTADKGEITSNKCLFWDQKAVALLDALSESVQPPERIDGIFDDYVCFGSSEEWDSLKRRRTHSGAQTLAEGRTNWSLLAKGQREWMQRCRKSLLIFGWGEETPATVLDLAILAENKLFLGHSATSAFLNRVWRSKAGNETWIDTKVTGASPAIKCLFDTVGRVVFICFYIWVYISLAVPSQRHAPDGREWLLWFWVLTAVCGEATELHSLGGLRQYLQGSGNQLDVISSGIFFLAALCRALAQLLPAAVSHVPYGVFMVLLTVNLLVTNLRLLKCFAFYKRVGVLHIIVVNIGLGPIIALYHRDIHFIPDSLIYAVPLFLRRQCDRAPGEHRATRRRALPALPHRLHRHLRGRASRGP
jgi:hypothetical protein